MDAVVSSSAIILKLSFEKNDKVVLFGEDVVKIEDVNQGAEGLQELFGVTRVFDTGIREATIIGQGIGMALCGLRPIAGDSEYPYHVCIARTPSATIWPLPPPYRSTTGCSLIIRTRVVIALKEFGTVVHPWEVYCTCCAE